MRAYHMTTKSKLREIEKSGVLEPRTSTGMYRTRLNVNGYEEQFNSGLYGKLWHNRFLVCGANRDFSAWKDFGMYGLLKSEVVRGSSERDFFILNFEADVFLAMDHSHWSSAECKRLYGKNLFHMARQRRGLEGKDREDYYRQFALYISSLTDDTKEVKEFRVPELWLPDPVKFSEVEVLELAA